MKVLNHTRPYEKVGGSAQLLYEKWNEKAKDNIKKSNKKEFNQNIKGIIQDFEHLEIIDIKKPKVGIVGEILLKYHPAANNDIISTLEEAGAEVVVPGLLDFFLYSSYNSKFQYQYLTRNKLQKELNGFILTVINHYKKVMERELGKSKRFTTSSSISHLAAMASPFLSLGNQTGEGWLIKAEMIELIESGASNIVCVQPLACLPNHITGKGMFKTLKEKFPQANIVPIDYDPGISEVNQLNRIKLMLSVAMKNM